MVEVVEKPELVTSLSQCGFAIIVACYPVVALSCVGSWVAEDGLQVHDRLVLPEQLRLPLPRMIDGGATVPVV